MLFKFAVACLRTILKLFSCFGLYIWNDVSAFELFHYVDVCDEAFGLDFNLLIVYNSYFIFVISFSNCESDQMLLILIIKIDQALAVFSNQMLVFVSSSSSLSFSKKLVISEGLLGWYLLIFGCLWGISGLFRFLFLPLTLLHEASSFVFCVLYVICFKCQ